MRGLVIRFVSNGVALGLSCWVIKGMEVNNVFALLVAAMVLGILNAFVRPLVFLLHLPFNIFLALGLLTLVVNAAMLMITSQAVNGFSVNGFLAAVIGTVVLSGFSFFTSLFIGDEGKIKYEGTIK